ncbi:anti-sigma factor family protein [Longirhabdus pacifica]|uniref:anti-sigma factor family protein n=1 Tax=Longirhabdus pacifica TaxID=2305227 RepID=UPI0010092B11|nr:hypothetical protein [Longirhabdus pacifica]
MKCHEIQEELGKYWDLNNDDAKKQQIDFHIKHCSACRREFEIWEESRQLISSTSFTTSSSPLAHSSTFSSSISNKVMDRIYEENSWNKPIARHLYTFSLKQRWTYLLAITLFLSLFILSFVLSVIMPFSDPVSPVQLSYNAIATPLDDSVVLTTASRTAVTSKIEDPFLLSIEDNPNYYLLFSSVGIIMLLLLLRWFIQIRNEHQFD